MTHQQRRGNETLTVGVCVPCLLNTYRFQSNVCMPLARLNYSHASVIEMIPSKQPKLTDVCRYQPFSPP